MNCDVDKDGPVNIDELMALHYSKVDRVVEGDGSKNRAIAIDTIENNAECVGNRTNSEWVVHRRTRRKVGGMKGRPLTSLANCRSHRNVSVSHQHKK
jgi:hypothetical protein